MFALIKNGAALAYPYTLRQFWLDNPNVSLPVSPTVAQLEEVGLFAVVQAGAPAVSAQEVAEDGGVALVNGAWTRQWTVRALTAAEIESNRQAAVPTSVSPRQIRQALTRAGLRTSVEAAVAAGDQDLKDWWEFATACERSNQHVIDMGAALGVSALQLDDLFTLAGSL